MCGHVNNYEGDLKKGAATVGIKSDSGKTGKTASHEFFFSSQIEISAC